MKECCGSPKDNPKTLALNISQNGFGTSTTFKVSGMDCADEVKAIEGSLQIPGVSKIHADLMKESVTIFHSQAVTRDDLAKLIAKAGVKVVDDGPRSFYQDHSRRIVYVGLSGAILAAGLLGDYFLQVNQSYSLAIFMLSIFFSGLLIFPKAWRSIKEFRFDMNVLMTLAVIGAVFIREYSEAASVVFLFSLAELLEAMSVSRARRAIQEVMKITAKMALVLDEDGCSVHTKSSVSQSSSVAFFVQLPPVNITSNLKLI